MGMFDTILIEVDCPKCNKKHEVEAQTKDLECNLHVWKVGSHLGDQNSNVNSVYCIASCKDKYISISEMNPKPKSLEEFAKRRGTLEFFNLKIKVNDRIVTNEYQIIP